MCVDRLIWIAKATVGYKYTTIENVGLWCDNERCEEKSRGLKILRAYLNVRLNDDINLFGLFREAKVGLL